MTQIEWIRYLHHARHPLLDSLIKQLDFFDRQEFLFILIPLIWLGYGWQSGLKLFYLLSLSMIVNYGLKHLFALPRPFHLDASLGIIEVSGYGFPSGAAQTAILLSGLLVIQWENRRKWVVAAVYTFFISFSRIYLGVHFPSDILGGWFVGLLLLGIYFSFFPRIEFFFQQRKPMPIFLISQLLPAILMICFPSKTILSICSCAIGIGLGVFLNRILSLKLTPPHVKSEFWLRAFIGAGGIFLIYYCGVSLIPWTSLATPLFLFFIIGMWISCFSLFICCQLTNFFRKEWV
jgi:undecaprenyl-diphosphatase